MALTQEQLSAAPSLRGVYDNKNVVLADDEKQVLEFQGLLEADGTLKDEAVKKSVVGLNLPPGMPAPVALAELSEQAAMEVEAGVAEIKGEHAEAAVVDESLQIDADGLAPPDGVDTDPADKTGGEGPAGVDARDAILASVDPVLCRHCGWDQRKFLKPPEHTAAEKLAFVRHMLGTTGRFYKTYSLFSGQMEITLRSRTQYEVDLILAQARRDMKNNNLSGLGDMVAQIQRYQVAASVHTIIDLNSPVTAVPYTTIEEYSKNKDVTLPVIEADKEIFHSGKPTALFDTILAMWFDFEHLYGWFSSRVHDRDFWTATGGCRS